MKVVHNLSVEAFLYPTEDFERVKKALDLVLPEKAKIKKEKVESYYGPEIVKLSFGTDKLPEVRKMLDEITTRLSKEDKRKVIETLDERMDSEGNLFLRFDKQKAYLGDLTLSYHGDVIKVRIKIASFPVNLQNIKYNAQILFE